MNFCILGVAIQQGSQQETAAQNYSITKMCICIYQRVFEGDQVLSIPFSFKHISEVL